MSEKPMAITPQNATSQDFMRQIHRLQWFLWRIAERPLEFNTTCRALAQEALTEPQLIDPEGAFFLWRDELTDETRDKVLRSSSQIGRQGILKPKGDYQGMDSNQKTQQEARTAPEPPKQIDMIEVESSNILRIGHDGEKTLRVEYKSNPGAPWDFVGVTSGEFIDIFQAESVGKTVIALTRNRGIKGEKANI